MVTTISMHTNLIPVFLGFPCELCDEVFVASGVLYTHKKASINWGLVLMLRNVVEACFTDACDFCAWLGCLKSVLEVHKNSQHGECMLQVMYLFRNKFDGSNFSIHPQLTKIWLKLRTWAPINGLHPSERYIAHYATYKDYALLGWAVGGPELPCYASV